MKRGADAGPAPGRCQASPRRRQDGAGTPAIPVRTGEHAAAAVVRLAG